MKKMFRYARRNICRAIYYWDSCPAGYGKNWKCIAQNALAMIALVFAAIAILSVMLIAL